MTELSYTRLELALKCITFVVLSWIQVTSAVHLILLVWGYRAVFLSAPGIDFMVLAVNALFLTAVLLYTSVRFFQLGADIVRHVASAYEEHGGSAD